MKKQVAVVGAKGYIGKHLCESLVKQGYALKTYSSGEKNGICVQTGLFTDPLVFSKDIDTVYYLANSPQYRQGFENPSHLLSVNCVAAVQAAEAARQAGVRRFIYTSTGNAYRPSFSAHSESAPLCRDNWYSLSKVMAENALELYRADIDVSVVRLFGVYGPMQTDKLVPKIANQIKSGLAVMIDSNPTDSNDRDGLAISLTYIDDVVKGLIQLMSVEHCARINLAGSEIIPIRMLANELALQLNLPCKIEVNQEIKRNCNFIADITLQNHLLNIPLVPFTEGIKRFCNLSIID